MKIGCWRKGHSLSSPYLSCSPASLLPSPFFPLSLPLLLSFVRASLSLGLGVMTAAPRCVRKLECHVLTGVRGMLTGQTEGTDGSVTCPRSSGVPLLGSLDLKSNTFFFLRLFPTCVFFRGSLPSLLPPFILSPPHVFIASSSFCFSFHSRLPCSFRLIYFFSVFIAPFPKSPAHAAAYLCLNTLAPNLH